MAYDDPVIEYEDPINEDPQNEKKKGGCYTLLTILIIVTLIGVSIPSLFWLFSLRERPSPTIVKTIVEVKVTVEVTATPGPTAVPALISQNEIESVNRIAFVNAEGQIVTIKPNGADAQLLTKGVQQFQYPAWSPDSSQLAMIGQDRTGGAVYIVDANAEEAQPDSVYNDRDNIPFYLYWSPNGKQISFIANNHLSGIALHVVPADGSNESRILSTGAPFYWDWAQDGEQMLVHSGGSGRQGRVEMIEVMDGDALDNLGRPGYFQSPGISANGRYWAYAERSGQNSHITIIDTETDAKQAEAHVGLAAMTWNPTMPLLAYISGGQAESESFIGSLRLMNAETGEITLLSRDDVVGFFWSPDGRYLATLNFIDIGNERDLNAQHPKAPLAKPAPQFKLPELELVIFDMTTMEGREMMRFVPTFTFLSQFLPFFDQYALSHQIWSPQSDALVLPTLEDNINKIVVFSVRTGEEQFIAEGNMPFWSLR